MPGLDMDIVVHRLSLKEGCSPVRQKLRRTPLDMSRKIIYNNMHILLTTKTFNLHRYCDTVGELT